MQASCSRQGATIHAIPAMQAEIAVAPTMRALVCIACTSYRLHDCTLQEAPACQLWLARSGS